MCVYIYYHDMVLKMGKSFPTTSGKSEPNRLMNAVWDQDKSRWTWGPWKCLTKKYNECAFSIFMHFLAMSVNQHRIHGSQKNHQQSMRLPLARLENNPPLGTPPWSQRTMTGYTLALRGASKLRWTDLPAGRSISSLGQLVPVMLPLLLQLWDPWGVGLSK